MRVAVVGLGYVGLVTATCLARLGQDVDGLESDTGRSKRCLLVEFPTTNRTWRLNWKRNGRPGGCASPRIPMRPFERRTLS